MRSVLLLAALATAVEARAVDVVVPIQGELVQKDGTLVDGEVKLKFLLLEPDGGVLWESQQRTVEVEHGAFTFLLGAQPPLGSDPGLNSDLFARDLDIAYPAVA